ncbi:MAG TPA: S8 family serine peptidase, partial [Verrucomicrobiae bacterium]|nr:S8 family serine peptidase [Verrucomicrobiae bacterium]
GAFLLFQLVALLVFAQNGSSPNVDITHVYPKSGNHKIQVSDPLLARQIESQGGQLIGDYGHFKLYEVPKLSPELVSNSRIELRDDYDVVGLNAGHLNTRSAQVQALSKVVGNFSGKHLHLIQFAGPPQPQWRNELLATGAQIISYVPQNCYLVYGNANSIAAVQKLAASKPYYQWQAAYLDSYKIHPRARNVDARDNPRNIGTDLFDIEMIDDPQANQPTISLLNQLALEPFKRLETNLHYVVVVARLNPNDLVKIAAQPEIVSILPYFHRQKLCERQDQIVAGNLSGGVPTGPGYLAWLTNKGFTQQQFTASGFAVDVSDSGIDNGTTAPNHFGLYLGGNASNASRIIYSRYESTVTYSTNSLEGCDGHGNINAHILGGYDDFSGFPFTDTQGFHFGLGVCPFVKMGSSVIFDSAESDNFYYPKFNNLQAEAYRDGARVSCNSWGATNSAGIYDSEAQRYDALVRDAQPTNSTVPMDGNQQMIIVFAGGNDGYAGSQTVNTPGTAKNVLTVGAADNVQVFGGSDNGGVGDNEATNANEIAPFSSRGPCADGRAKPDLVAPGTHVSGGVPQETNDFFDYPDGLANPCYNGSDISGGPGGSIFWPTNQQFYTASSGTSQATPCVGGGCALVYQYFVNHFTNAPSPAMTKAFLMNSARYLTGATADDTVPSRVQGMGEMDLGTAFDGVPRILSDQEPDDLFTNSGDARSYTGYVNNTNKDFRVTLAWTDAPGGTFGNAWNNDLDLTVTVGGHTYKGNVFNGAYSTPGGAADGSNNVESVF